PIMGPLTNAAWMASVAFDGARAFAGLAPDLDKHAERCIASARILGLEPPLDAADIVVLAWEGIDRFEDGAELYIRPMFFAEDGFVTPKPESTRFVLTLFEAPIPKPRGFTAHLSAIRRPTPESAPTRAKASCLYPQTAAALRAAREAGFDNAVVLDANGNVAEFATANIFIARDGRVATPVANGTFLAGITRARVIGLLGEAGIEVAEATLGFDDVMAADEVFSTGNYAKVTPLIGLEDRTLQPGPIYAKARELYFDWAKTTARPEA
ncbi:MAG: branched-chain amino acid aminotransferase, partial [Alphaproteobacteria bacterium]|nr:branched-chain amino acid aminotransferase [Alphaproteobacteria bacterium]